MKKAFDLIAVDGESKRKAMLSAGYAKTVADKPQNLTQTVGWQELLHRHLSQQSLAQQHQSLLATGKEETKVKLLDMGYKLHGVYAPERSLNIGITLKPSEHKDIADEYEARLLESIGQDAPTPLKPSNQAIISSVVSDDAVASGEREGGGSTETS